MKKINLFHLAMTFAGSFLGAGFVSGQELWQFFGNFGKPGFLGLSIAMVLLFLFGAILLYLANKRGIVDMAEIVVPHHIPWLRTLVGIAEVILLFGVYIIMAAGAASLSGVEEAGEAVVWGGALQRPLQAPVREHAEPGGQHRDGPAGPVV